MSLTIRSLRLPQNIYLVESSSPAAMIPIFVHSSFLLLVELCWAQFALEGHSLSVKLLPHIVVKDKPFWSNEGTPSALNIVF